MSVSVWEDVCGSEALCFVDCSEATIEVLQEALAAVGGEFHVVSDVDVLFTTARAESREFPGVGLSLSSADNQEVAALRSYMEASGLEVCLVIDDLSVDAGLDASAPTASVGSIADSLRFGCVEVWASSFIRALEGQDDW